MTFQWKVVTKVTLQKLQISIKFCLPFMWESEKNLLPMQELLQRVARDDRVIESQRIPAMKIALRYRIELWIFYQDEDFSRKSVFLVIVAHFNPPFFSSKEREMMCKKGLIIIFLHYTASFCAFMHMKLIYVNNKQPAPLKAPRTL